MATLTVPIRRAQLYLRVARSDSLVRNSFYMMATTVVTAGLGYIFWIITARMFTSAQIGIASAVISLCSTVALLTYLGAGAILIERLHTYERSRQWTAMLVRICVATSMATALVAAIAIPVFARAHDYGSFFRTAGALVIAILGSALWTLVNLFGSAFVSARRAGGVLSVQALVSVVKLLLVVPAAALGLGAAGIVGAWVASAFIGVIVSALWFIPRLGLGRRPPGSASHRAVGIRRRSAASGTELQRPTYRGVRRNRAPRSFSSFVRRLVGQHLTTAGGALTPLVLPTLVVLRLGVTPNAYFYITWMLGSIFFMVSPALSNALFAESVRTRSSLRVVIAKAFRVTSFLLIPAIIVMIASGKIILGLFGRSYAAEGYDLLVVLAISAIPDAVSNIAVAVLQATHRLVYSATLNIGIMITTFCCAWLLMPSLGILGAGVGWITAQVLGAIASLPAFRNMEATGYKYRNGSRSNVAGV